jgi:hypothetical protein
MVDLHLNVTLELLACCPDARSKIYDAAYSVADAQEICWVGTPPNF